MFMVAESTAYGRTSQPYSVEISGYLSRMKNIGEILSANATVLMTKKYGRVNVTKLASEPGLSVGVAGRIKKGENVQLDSLQAFAKAFKLDPWQALVPDLSVDSLPRLSGDASEWPLDMIDKSRYLALSKRSRDLAQGYLLRALEELELKESKTPSEPIEPVPFAQKKLVDAPPLVHPVKGGAGKNQKQSTDRRRH